MRIRNKRRFIVFIAVLTALLLILIGVINSETSKKDTLQTGTTTEGHADSGYAGSTGRETAENNRGITDNKQQPGDETTSGGSQPTATETPNTTPTEGKTGIRHTIYGYPSSGVGPGDTSNVNCNPTVRYYDAELLEKGLLYDLKPYAADFIQAQETYAIDAVFLAAVAAEESGYGRYAFRKNNIFGYGSKDFDSVPQCIDYVARKLRENYLTPGGVYYKGESIASISTYYCNGNTTWVANVTQIMKDIDGRINHDDGRYYRNEGTGAE